MKLGIFIKDPRMGESPRFKSMVDKLTGNGFAFYRINERDDIEDDTDMVLSVGGDGTFLSATKRVADSGIPIFGVNLGRVGFLSENDPETVVEALLDGSYIIEDRVMLSAVVSGGDLTMEPGFWPYALNEVTLHRCGPSVIGIDVCLNGTALPTYWADGLLVSTASGSTAYSLSAGGPICLPDTQVFIIEPIAPHNLNLRPLIVPQTSSVKLSFQTRDSGAVLSMDNRTMNIEPDWTVEISMAQFSLKRISLSKSNFVKALTGKLFWGEDIRNNEDL